MRSGCSGGSICWMPLVSGRFSWSKIIIPEAREHVLIPSPRRHTHLFGGLGLMCSASATRDDCLEQYDDAIQLDVELAGQQ